MKEKIHELKIELEIVKENAEEEKSWMTKEHEKSVDSIHEKYDEKIRKILESQTAACEKYEKKIESKYFSNLKKWTICISNLRIFMRRILWSCHKNSTNACQSNKTCRKSRSWLTPWPERTKNYESWQSSWNTVTLRYKTSKKCTTRFSRVQRGWEKRG